MARQPPYRKPFYPHRVWNRTDLTVSQVDAGNLIYSLGGPPYINKKFPPENYKGETIPPYACMRVATNPVYYRDQIVWPVCRPDDSSLSLQQPGMHFFNGPVSIPFTKDKNGVPNGYGDATNDLPAPVLVDLTGNSSKLPYGNTAQLATPGQLAGLPLNLLTFMVGTFSGTWALHIASDIINAAGNLLRVTSAQVGISSVNVSAIFIPWTIIGQMPDLSRKPPAGLDFWYSSQVMWVGGGSLGFGAAVAQPGA